jgi:heme oxygenase
MSSSPPWMLVRLGLETAVHHGPADEDRLAALDIKSVADYRAFLIRVYGFESALEAAVTRVRGIDQALCRGRTSRLRRDLIALGVKAEDVARVPKAALQIRTVPEAIGWLFVLERQALLAGQLQRQLLRVLGDAIKSATLYLAACGDCPGARLRVFGEAAGYYAQSYPPRMIVAGAQEAFRAQRQWYMSSRNETYTGLVDDAAVA